MYQIRQLQQEIHNSTTNLKITSCVGLSGTTWMQEIVPLIVSQGDPEVVDTVPNWVRVPWLESTKTRDLNLEQKPSPRVFSTHFHYNMMSTDFLKVKPRVRDAAWSHTGSLWKDKKTMDMSLNTAIYIFRTICILMIYYLVIE